MAKRWVWMALAIAALAGCGGGGGDGDTRQPALQAGGVREADGTVAYCEDFAAPAWPPLRFLNNVWGKGPITDYEQCILARDGDMGVEYGWRWDWPMGDEIYDGGWVKAFPEVIYGQKPTWRSTAPDVPIRVSDVDEMMVRWDIDMTATGTYNLAFDMFFGPEPTATTDEVMIWVDWAEGMPDSLLVDAQDMVAIDGVTYSFHRVADVSPYPASVPPPAELVDEGHLPPPDWTINMQHFVSPPGRFSGTLNLVAFFDYLVDEGHIPASHWVNSIEFGNEVTGGQGEVWLVEYEVAVTGKGEAR